MEMELNSKKFLPIYHFTTGEHLKSIIENGLFSRNEKAAFYKKEEEKHNLMNTSICFTPLTPEQDSNILHYGDYAITIMVNPDEVYVNDQEDIRKIYSNKDYKKSTLREYLKMNEKDRKENYPFPEVRISKNRILPNEFSDIIKFTEVNNNSIER